MNLLFCKETEKYSKHVQNWNKIAKTLKKEETVCLEKIQNQKYLKRFNLEF